MFVSRKLLDSKKKVATSEPLVKSLTTKNKTLKNKVAVLTTEVGNNKERMATLEKSLQVEKKLLQVEGRADW